MEKTFFLSMLFWLGAYIAPFVMFFSGVGIGIKAKLHGSMNPRVIWMTALPVALLTIGNLLSATTYMASDPDGSGSFRSYGYLDSVHQALIFYGTVMFYGTMSPQIFQKIRERLPRTSAPEENAT